MNTETKNRNIGILLATSSAILFSLKGIILKVAFTHGASVDQMMALRAIFALPFFVFIGILAYRKGTIHVTRKMFLLAVGLGILGYYVCSWLDFSGLKYISAQLERLILFLYPTITALLAWAFLGDRITWRHVMALILSYSGIAVLVSHEIGQLGPDAILGAGLVFAAAVLFAVYVTAAKPVISKLSAPLYTSIAMTGASIVILTIFAGQTVAAEAAPMSATIWGLGFLLATLCTVAPAFMMSDAIGRIGPGLTSAVGGLGPPTTALMAVLFLSEPFGGAQILALLLTVSGVLLLSKR